MKVNLKLFNQIQKLLYGRCACQIINLMSNYFVFMNGSNSGSKNEIKKKGKINNKTR